MGLCVCVCVCVCVWWPYLDAMRALEMVYTVPLRTLNVAGDRAMRPGCVTAVVYQRVYAGLNEPVSGSAG